MCLSGLWSVHTEPQARCFTSALGSVAHATYLPALPGRRFSRPWPNAAAPPTTEVGRCSIDDLL